jgi:DNA primase
MKSLNVKSTKTVMQMRLPLDYTKEIPAQGLAYLYVRGVTDADIKRWKIGYSPKYSRVIFPVYEGRNLVFFQGRTISEVTRESG